NSDFIDYLIANSYFTSSLAGDTNFLTNLITNINTSGTLAVVTDGVTITGDGTTGNPLTATGGSDNYTVKATTADTTQSFLDDKTEVVSTHNTITVTPSVINPAANEKLRFDLSVDTSTLASSLYPTLVPFGSPGGSPPNPGLLGTIGNFATFNNNH